MLLLFWSSEHTWRKNQFCLEIVPPSLSFLTLWEHRRLKLKVPVYHWPAQPACSRTYFTLVSGLWRPPRSFVCLHMLGFSVPTLPEGLHHNGSWPSSEGTLPLGDGGPAVSHLRENLSHMFCFGSWGAGQIGSVLVIPERPMLSSVRWPS